MGRRPEADRIKEARGTLQRCRSNPNEPMPDRPLGAPPKSMSADERAAWRELAATVEDGVLTVSDRWSVEILARLMATYRRRDPLTPTEFSTMVKLLGVIGATPADRPRVTANPKPLTDEFAQFKT